MERREKRLRQEQNLYEYLYQALAVQIESGIYPRALPSQQEICKRYNVGITTVRKVLNMLNENGYIRTARGMPAAVVYRAPPEARMAALAGRREQIADAYMGTGLLMPSLYVEGARRCGADGLRRLQEICGGVAEGADLPALYRQANLFFSELLTPLENQLVMDLERDVENYQRIPYLPFPGLSNPFELTSRQLKAWLQTAISQIRQKRLRQLYDSIVLFYRESSRKVDGYLLFWSRQTGTPPSSDGEIRWFRGKGRSELYAHLAMTILRRIVSREFDGQRYLPSIPALMEEYHVTKDTASRALALLYSLGITQTLNRKGTIVASGQFPVRKLQIELTDPVVRRRISYFLDALQIMALTIRGSAAAFLPVSRDLAQGMEEQLEPAFSDRISPMAVQMLMHCSIELAPCHSLRNIYRQLNELLVWGYYLHAVDESFYPDNSGIARAMERVVRVLHGKDQKELPQALELAFSLIYDSIRTVIEKVPELSGLAGRR